MGPGRPPGQGAQAGLSGPADSGRTASRGAAHRQFSDADLAAAALGLSIERRYDISPAALSFGIQVLADPRITVLITNRPADALALRSALLPGAGPSPRRGAARGG